MKYYSKDNRVHAFYTEGAEEITNPIREDGTLYPKHENTAHLERDENGRLFEYYNNDGTPNLTKAQELLDIETYNQWKQDRTEAVSNIVVDVDGVRFDGDEDSQARMSRAIQVLIGDETIQWITADNNVVTTNQTVLGVALKLAGIEQARIWIEGK